MTIRLICGRLWLRGVWFVSGTADDRQAWIAGKSGVRLRTEAEVEGASTPGVDDAGEGALGAEAGVGLQSGFLTPKDMPFEVIWRFTSQWV